MFGFFEKLLTHIQTQHLIRLGRLEEEREWKDSQDKAEAIAREVDSLPDLDGDELLNQLLHR